MSFVGISSLSLSKKVLMALSLSLNLIDLWIKCFADLLSSGSLMYGLIPYFVDVNCLGFVESIGYDA